MTTYRYILYFSSSLAVLVCFCVATIIVMHMAKECVAIHFTYTSVHASATYGRETKKGVISLFYILACPFRLK